MRGETVAGRLGALYVKACGNRQAARYAMDLLKLVAFDEEDLAVISAHLQDAALRVDDIAYLPKERRFALCARRFDWTCDLGENPRRRLTGLHFDNVSAVRCKNMDQNRKDQVLNLLAVTFEQTTAPSGCVTLIFSEDRALKLDVECIEAHMKDMGPVWEVECRPRHDIEAGEIEAAIEPDTSARAAAKAGQPAERR